MKKTKFMRAALLLLVLTLITSCFVGGTFAKYTTSAEGTDKARVAYWGFDQEAYTAFDLFDVTYDNVKAQNNENVVAPGTSKSTTFAFGYTGNTAKSITAPEVKYNFKVDVTTTGTTTEFDNNTSFKWTLQKGTDEVNKEVNKYDTFAELASAIKLLSGTASGSMDYEAGTLPGNFASADKVYTIGWEWAFDGNDIDDTELGNMQDLKNVEIAITITATQID